MRNHFTSLSLDSASLRFGLARFPLSRKGVTIGEGDVVPEIKFTLPPMDVHTGSMREVRNVYGEIIDGVCRRAADLHQSQLIVEFELLPEMTVHPEWGEEITSLLHNALEQYRDREGIQSLLRVTPVDIRESHRPPRRRDGRDLELMLDAFRRCARAGGDLLSIESTGGKEVTDPSIMAADMRGILFGTVILGCSDMEFLWEHICSIAAETATIPAGDTACGIGNTAMVLADQGYVPKVFAAVVRAVTAVRSLVAYEVGAVGPGKDCGYENAILKAVTGYPMSLEGRSAACAHFSAVGNITGAYADLWSNESVQHIKLLSGMAPVVSLEQLVYDCRLFNAASRNGTASQLRDMLIESDASLDPQAFILRPDIVVALAECIIGEDDDYLRGVCSARTAVEIMRHGVSHGELLISDREQKWLEKMEAEIDQLPQSSSQFIAGEKTRWKDTVDYSQYMVETVRS
ncbi:MAG TPA: methyltransferase MtaB domain-containing protein [Bacteroidota bacterium]